MARGIFSSLLPLLLALLLATSSAQPVVGADVAVQYVQISTHTAMTINGQVVTGANAAKLMSQQMTKGMMAGVAQSLMGSVLQQVLSAVNPILAMAAQLIAAKAQQKLAESMTPKMKMGVTEVNSEAVTTTASTLRRRIDDGNITVLVQCDLGRLVTIDNTAHTYYVKTFDELASEGAAAVATDASGKDAASTDCKAPKSTVEHASDDQTDTIAGMTAHHKIETTIYIFPPGCMPRSNKANGMLDPNQQKWTTERWYATSDIPNKCEIPVAGNDPDPQTATTVEIPLRIVRKIDMSQMQAQLDAQLKSMPPNPLLQSSGVLDVLSHLSNMLTFTTETQSVKQVPYDALSFDAPTGYTQTEAGPTPPPAVRQSS